MGLRTMVALLGGYFREREQDVKIGNLVHPEKCGGLRCAEGRWHYQVVKSGQEEGSVSTFQAWSGVYS